jgi:hypothetical protein
VATSAVNGRVLVAMLGPEPFPFFATKHSRSLEDGGMVFRTSTLLQPLLQRVPRYIMGSLDQQATTTDLDDDDDSSSPEQSSNSLYNRLQSLCYWSKNNLTTMTELMSKTLVATVK